MIVSVLLGLVATIVLLADLRWAIHRVWPQDGHGASPGMFSCGNKRKIKKFSSNQNNIIKSLENPNH